MRDWIPKHFDFAGYVIGEHPQTFGDRESLRKRLGYRDDERICIVTVGGSGHPYWKIPAYLKIRRAGPEPAPHPLCRHDIMETAE